MQQSLKFLTDLFKTGYSFNQISTARSVLSALIDTLSWGNTPIVKRFMKGLFESRPIFPKYNCIWDVGIVFNFVRNLPSTQKLSLKVLTKKMAFLLTLVSDGQQRQTIHALNLKDIIVPDKKVIILVMEKMKQTTVGQHMTPLKFKYFLVEPKLCVLAHLNIYFKKTKSLRRSSKLFVSYIRPHKAISKDTLARWCKSLLAESGIDLNKSSTHSCRSALSSKAKRCGVTLAKILDSTG